jgi:glycosyltransferase involved in cell wall biosynthesis
MSSRPDPATKIAFVIGQLAQGGSERQLYTLLEHCDRGRWVPVVYVSRGPMGFWDDPIRALGIPVILLHGNPIMRMWQFRQSCRAKRIRRFFSWAGHTNAYGLALLGLGIRRIGSFRNVFRSEMFGRFGRISSWINLAIVSTIVCNSQETTDAVRRRVGDRKRVVYVPNSVQPVEDVAYYRRTWRQRLGISAGDVLILGVGRLTPQKNYDRFIEVVARVHRTTPIKVVVAGRDDGCLGSLQHQVDQAGIEPGVVRFIGPVPDARELMCAADVFMLSSDYEGMPNVVLEAMAAGVPCVCTRVNGVSALIEHGINGFITDHRADALAEKALLLVRDKKLREEMGGRASERMNGSFDPKVIAARLWQLCE